MSKAVEGLILIASPKIKSGLFKQAVIYIHTSDETGAVGVILNVPMDPHMAETWSKDIGWQFPERVHLGGPIERQLGYVLHSTDYAQTQSIHLNDYISYTGGKHIVADINRGIGPSKFLLVTGYCGWQPGQLVTEIQNGSWVVVDFDSDFFFQDLGREAGWEFAVHVAAQNKTTKLLDMVDSI